MGWYGERVLPRLINIACGAHSSDPTRSRVCARLAGEVVEVGFGSGLNIAFYPATVTRVAAVEPAELGWQLAAGRVGEAAVPITWAGRDAQRLPFPDNSYDAALSTWTLCTIPDADAALRELRRVLRPGGALHFVEHGLAPDESVRRWQRRLEPLQGKLFGGCHLTRQIDKLITAAGFTIEELDVYYEKGAPKAGLAMSLGVARPLPFPDAVAG